MILISLFRLTAREEAAVGEWIESGLPFHIMRLHWSNAAHTFIGSAGTILTTTEPSWEACGGQG